MRYLQHSSAGWWLKLAVVNFLIVGVLGLFMRLKIILPIPWLQQQNLLHAHSHFAFAGWVTHTLMVLVLIAMASRLLPDRTGEPLSGERGLGRLSGWQRILILANLVTAYGMLIAFLFQGYGKYSIAAASLGILVSYFFAVHVWRRAGRSGVDRLTLAWFRAAVIFLVLSSLGTFVLTYLMVNHNTDPRKQLAAVYFYLHFQYNGWFLLACMGLFQQWLSRQGIRLKWSPGLFRVFAFACIPTYFLSVLWWDMPMWLYWLLVVAALAQLTVWSLWFYELLARRGDLRSFTSRTVRFLLLVVGLGFSVKLLLQALSLIPELSQFAYGFRPIVIAYLHLVLLVVISLFLLAYLFSHRILRDNKLVRVAVLVTFSGILLNELLLALQGLSGMLRLYINHIPQVLAVAAGIICTGIFGILLGQLKQDAPERRRNQNSGWETR